MGFTCSMIGHFLTPCNKLCSIRMEINYKKTRSMSCIKVLSFIDLLCNHMGTWLNIKISCRV